MGLSVLSGSGHQRYREGEVVFHVGEAGTLFYVLFKGEMSVQNKAGDQVLAMWSDAQTYRDSAFPINRHRACGLQG